MIYVLLLVGWVISMPAFLPPLVGVIAALILLVVFNKIYGRRIGRSMGSVGSRGPEESPMELVAQFGQRHEAEMALDG